MHAKDQQCKKETAEKSHEVYLLSNCEKICKIVFPYMRVAAETPPHLARKLKPQTYQNDNQQNTEKSSRDGRSDRL